MEKKCLNCKFYKVADNIENLVSKENIIFLAGLEEKEQVWRLALVIEVICSLVNCYDYSFPVPNEGEENNMFGETILENWRSQIRLRNKYVRGVGKSLDELNDIQHEKK
jgi:hypothetical protein